MFEASFTISMSENELTNNHNWINFEYDDIGICNAAKTVMIEGSTPNATNECMDWQLIAEVTNHADIDCNLPNQVTQETKLSDEYARHMEIQYSNTYLIPLSGQSRTRFSDNDLNTVGNTMFLN
jgi:hypothetical protein